MASKKKDELAAAPASGMAAYTTAGAMPPEMTVLTAPDRIERLTLAQGQMQAILDRKASPGDWLHGIDAENLGPTLEAWVAAWRPHAIRVEDDEVVEESFDPESEVFRAIVRDSAGERIEGVRNAYGPEFLLWLVKQGTWGLFTFSGTARQRGKLVFRRMGAGVALCSETRKSRKHSWLVPTVADVDVSAPNDRERELAVQVFLAPVEAAKASDRDLADGEEI
jgi:hypothetical protein